MKLFHISRQHSSFIGVYNSRSKSIALKASLFATGCAGIVAEFVLSTLATYLIGNAIFQWTIVMSLMLFAMGLGSRLSRMFHKDLLDTFIFIEFLLSILCAISAELAYGLAAFTQYIALIIYLQAFIIGCLIGLEIPLVTRLNDEYEELRINISGVMEKDYFGALFGGLLFAFIALPYLGMTYTPIILGSINFLVASFLLWRFVSLVRKKKILIAAFVLSLLFLSVLALFAEPIIRFGEQKKYKDKVIYSKQTKYQKIVMTRWKDYYWLFINSQEQFSTFDEEKYHEPLVHPAMKIARGSGSVLILGGGDGLALREVLKHGNVTSVTLVDMDPVMTNIAKNHPLLIEINNGSMKHSKVTIINQDASIFLKKDSALYSTVIIDLPDPDSIDLMHVYSENFYRMVQNHLERYGVMVTQASSPLFSKKAFLCIMKTIRASGFSILPYHNQIPTMGEWGWVLGVKESEVDEKGLRTLAMQLRFDAISTRFLNNDAMISMIHFGKGILGADYMDQIRVNTELNPVLYRYYHEGTWDMY